MLDNTFLGKLHVFKIMTFPEKNNTKQVQMFYQNSLTLNTVEIFCNLILRKII